METGSSSMWKQLPIRDEIISVVESIFGFRDVAEVQKRCIPQLLSHKDVIVQAPTGSGKTLAFVIPILEILLRREEPLKKWQIGALILVPNRELAVQITTTIQRFLDNLSAGVCGNPLRLICFVGGTKLDDDVGNFKQMGGNIIVATPGRLCDLLTQNRDPKMELSGHLKTLEVLILDEADRLLEMGFQDSLREILTRLPKQRRTGLFSATQTEALEELTKTGLRNPTFITVYAAEFANNLNSAAGGCSTAEESVMPTTLKNYYAVIPTEAKFTALEQFILENWHRKILVFLSTCACVDYFGDLMKRLVEKKKKKRRMKNKKIDEDEFEDHILTLHGKKKKKRRQIFDQFRNRPSGVVLICTDVMARGIDIENIDWVVQIEPPRQASWFVHRCGRTARCGKTGNALLFLSPSEDGYVDFLRRNQNVTLTRMTIDYEQGREWKTLDRIRDVVSRSRELLEKGSKAFVSCVQAYSKHDCHIVCSLKELDVVNLAHCFGLYRLPRMPELRGRDLSGFRRCDLNTWDIAYEDKTREKSRKELVRRRDTNDSDANTNMNSAEEVVADEDRPKSEVTSSKRKSRPRQRRKEENEMDDEELDDLDQDYKMVKRFKKGKMSKEKFDECFLK